MICIYSGKIVGEIVGLSDIKGQEIPIRILNNSVLKNHVSHAYLFQGTEGVGKKTTALALAQTLNCLNPQGALAESCGICLSCIKLKEGNHPDVQVMEPEKYSIKIDQIRSLRNKVFYKCYEGKYKVIIIDDAHCLTTEASNSLLKVLEEPPEKTVFILVTSEPSKLPETIISRCQQVQFQPLSVNTIRELWSRHNLGQPEHLNLAASLGGGSLSKTQELINEGEIFSQRQETINFISKLGERSFNEIIFWCEQWDRQKQKVKTILEIMQLWFRDLLVYRTTGQEKILINQDYLEEIKNSRQSLTNINNALLLINELIKNLEYNVNPGLMLEVFLMKLKLN